MKKFMFAAIAALAITSCSQNEEFEAPSQKSVIDFNTVVSKSTRAAITDNAALQESGFEVYAYSSAGEISTAFPATFSTLMAPATVTYDKTSSTWKIDNDYYWPLEEKVHFYAFAQDNNAQYVAPTESTYPTLTYTIADVAADQKDFVLVKLENQGLSKTAVPLTFLHALTQVNFSIQGDKEGFTYTVNSIKIANVAKTGTYSFGTGQWTAGSELTASYNYPINEAMKTATGLAKKDLDVSDNTLMLMPQDMNADTKIIVSYSVSKNDKVVYKTGVDGFEIKLDGKTSWGAGKKIRYTLTLANGSVSMTFAPTVGGWGADEDNGQN